MTRRIVSTVGQIITLVLPQGTNEISPPAALARTLARGDVPPDWVFAPQIATDLFAVTAYLCRIGGVVGFFNPSPYADPGAASQFCLTREDRDTLDTIAWTWRGGKRGGRPRHPDRGKSCDPSPGAPKSVQGLWSALLDCWDQPVNCGYYVNGNGKAGPAPWWPAAFKLALLADMVVEKLYASPAQRFEGTSMGDLMQALIYKHDKNERGADGINPAADGKPPEPLPVKRGFPSVTLMVDTAIACVMPKMRVAAVGATIRNATRNLALLPGRGEMRCYWDMTDAEPLSEDESTLDLLLIPAPFSLRATDFVPATDENLAHPAQDLHNDKPDWESFDLKQPWLEDEARIAAFVQSCDDLLKAAKEETRTINGVVLPEYALTWKVFERLCDTLKQREKNLEFVIAGASENCDLHPANTLLHRVWRRRDPDLHFTNSRRKHHRWRLDRGQVESYGLGSVLNPKVRNWWENTPIGQREIYFHHFRKDSVFAALICEELARSDVCHDILRAVGPNLVFALLMDSAQIRGRWPAQYAGSLADDPGCAVLSLTSYALVERSNRNRVGGSRSIALWKDDTGRLVEIDMPTGNGPRGVLLSLWSEHIRDQTLAGKRSDVRAWRYSSHAPLVPLAAPAPPA